MGKRIIYTRPDGGISVINPAPQARVALAMPEVAKMTPDEFFDFVKAKDVPPDATNVQVVDESEIPAERSKREAWSFPDGKFKIDPAKDKPKPEDNKKALRDELKGKGFSDALIRELVK